ncbi:MAG: ABC transporter permease [Candidatus Nanopelagicales bacterium]
MNATARSRWTRLGVGIVPLAFTCVFFLYPVITLLVRAFKGTDGWDLGALASVFTQSSMRHVVAFTLWQAFLSTALVLIVGLPSAWVVARFRFRGRAVVEALATVAFIMPTVVVATAISAALSDDGPLGWLLPRDSGQGIPAILAAHVYFNFAIVLRMVGSYWRQLDPRVEQSAAALGAGPWRVFTTITWPRLRPVVWAAAGIVFLFCVTSFGVVLLLGLPGQATVEVEIQRQVMFLFNLPLGAALSVVQIGIVVLMLLVQARLSRRLRSSHADSGDLGNAPEAPASDRGMTPDATGMESFLPDAAGRRPHSPRERAIVAAFLVVSLTLLVGPIVAVLQRALRVGQGYGLDNFTALGSSRAGSILFVSPTAAIANSLMFAVAATAIALVVGTLAAFVIAGGRARVLSGLLLLPLGVSAVTLGFGAVIAFGAAPLDLRSSPLMVPIVQSLIAIPFVVRSIVPVLRAIRVRLRQAAATLGASPWQVVRTIDLPLLSRSVAIAAGFAFAISLGEFGATVFVARSDHPTVPVAIYRFLGSPGDSNQGQAMAMAMVLIALTATAVLLAERMRLPGSR